MRLISCSLTEQQIADRAGTGDPRFINPVVRQ